MPPDVHAPSAVFTLAGMLLGMVAAVLLPSLPGDPVVMVLDGAQGRGVHAGDVAVAAVLLALGLALDLRHG